VLKNKKKNHGKVTTHNYQALDQGTKKLTASLFFLAAHEHTKKKKKKKTSVLVWLRFMNLKILNLKGILGDLTPPQQPNP
jgi:hypothetical protein